VRVDGERLWVRLREVDDALERAAVGRDRRHVLQEILEAIYDVAQNNFHFI